MGQGVEGLSGSFRTKARLRAWSLGFVELGGWMLTAQPHSVCLQIDIERSMATLWISSSMKLGDNVGSFLCRGNRRGVCKSWGRATLAAHPWMVAAGQMSFHFGLKNWADRRELEQEELPPPPPLRSSCPRAKALA